jgi:hypothetical protein
VTIDPGDYNDDGAVDAADYVVWRDTLNQAVTFPGSGADGDGNGAITTADYNVWAANFGKLSSAGSTSPPAGSVPEPFSLAMVLVASAQLLLLRKRG